MPFKPGESGNPVGRPPSAETKAGRLRQMVRPEEEEEVVRAVVTAAKAGDMLAARILFDRLYAPPRAEPVHLPELREAATTEARCEVVIAAVADGRITAEEAERLLRVVDLTTKARAFDALEERVKELEKIADAKRVLVDLRTKRVDDAALPAPAQDGAQ